jgi:alpha-galactosidase
VKLELILKRRRIMGCKGFWELVMSIVVLIAISGHSSGADKGSETRVANEGGKIMVVFDQNLNSKVRTNIGTEIEIGVIGASEYITVNHSDITEFHLVDFTAKDWRDSLGSGREFEITGVAENLRKTVSIVRYNDFPTALFFNVTYRNTGDKEIIVNGWTNNQYRIATHRRSDGRPSLWSYQPGSYGWDNNWVLPVDSGYARENFLGMTAEDYGGGTPVVDIWRPDCGIAVGHVERVPKYVSLPVSMMSSGEATLGITYKKDVALKPGATLSTFRTFAIAHQGDYFNALTVYRQFMEHQGITFKDVPEAAYGNEWCGWAYEQDFTMEQMYNTLPKVKDLGIEWVVMDMGWYDGVGDYQLPKKRFPNGEADIRQFVETVHSYGLKVQLWWLPLAVGLKTDLMAKHPDYLLLNEDGSPRFMPAFFKSFFLCPASGDVIEHSRQQVLRFMKWGFDGLKIDGNNQNCVPPCYNPDHRHARPEESLEALPGFYKTMYETALSVNPNAKIQICPCGTNQSFYLLPYMNETVASDPHSSYQIRIKGKTIKALTGTKSVFYGDHVEHSDGKCDFASTIAVGGTIGSKFVYPPGSYMNKETGDVSLTPAKEAEWRKWINITKQNPLPRGIYRGELYDIGFDLPETHAVQLKDALYYGFFAPTYTGQVEFRGLRDKEYTLVDYEHNVELGTVKGPVAKFNASFTQRLLVKAEPRKK